MSVPKKKKSHSKARKQRNHQALTMAQLGPCLADGLCSGRPRHTLCDLCGRYAGGGRVRQVFTPVERDAEG